MKKRMIIMLACLAILFGALIGWRAFINYKIKNFFLQPMPPVVISTMKVKLQNWQPHLTSVGTLVAQQKVDIVPQVEGIVSKIHFKSGDVVKQGTLLVELDARVEQTNLASNKAKLMLAEIDFQRTKNLYTKQIVSRANYDKSLAELAQAKAAVARDEALIAQKQITAPFDGKLGIRQINLGEYLSPNSIAIVNLQTLDLLEVEFSLTQQDLAKVKIQQKIVFSVDAFPGKKFDGLLTATNAGFDQNSRMLLVRASLPNLTRELYPGMYGEVKVLLPEIQGIVAVPQTAVEYNLYSNTVYVVKHEGEKSFVKQVSVILGQRYDDIIVIKQGLQSGDQIVIAGQIKLFDHALVEISNEQESIP